MQSLTAAEMLVAGGLDVDRVRYHLRRVDPSSTNIQIAPSWFRRFWAKGIAAVCMPWAIYVHPEIMDRYTAGEGRNRIATLIAHELTHLEQYRRLGATRHSVRYVSDYLVGRRRGLGHWAAYRAIGLEREARHVAAVVTAEAAS